MSTTKAKLTGKSVEVGGHDISSGVRSYILTASALQLPILQIDLMVDEVMSEGEVEYLIPQPTRDVLVALGWTPPPED